MMESKERISFETQGITKSERILYTPSEFTKRTSFYVQEVGHLTSLSSHKSTRNNLQSYLLLEVDDGSGTITIEGQVFHLMKGDSVLINCEKPYEHASDEKDLWSLSWVHFNGIPMSEYFELISKYCHGTPVFRFELKIDELVDELLAILKENNFENELKASEILQQFLNKLVKKVMISDSRSGEIDWNYVREEMNQLAVEEQNETEKYLNRILEEYAISRAELFDGFKNKFGIGIDNYIEQRKLTIAKEKLRFTTLSEEEVAKSIGISDSQKFIELFNKHENSSPSEYRRSWAQWIRK